MNNKSRMKNIGFLVSGIVLGIISFLVAGCEEWDSTLRFMILAVTIPGCLFCIILAVIYEKKSKEDHLMPKY